MFLYQKILMHHVVWTSVQRYGKKGSKTSWIPMLSVFSPTNQICLAPGCEKLLQEVVLEITNTETGRLDSKCSHYSFRKDLCYHRFFNLCKEISMLKRSLPLSLSWLTLNLFLLLSTVIIQKRTMRKNPLSQPSPLRDIPITIKVHYPSKRLHQSRLLDAVVVPQEIFCDYFRDLMGKLQLLY